MGQDVNVHASLHHLKSPGNVHERLIRAEFWSYLSASLCTRLCSAYIACLGVYSLIFFPVFLSKH